jgi:hypothetical protein
VEGKCRECGDGSHCDAGEYCDAGTHTCVESVAGAGIFCEAAVDVSYCAGGAWVSASGGLGYCSATCAVPGDCPAGWDCREGTCAVKRSCLDLVASFGSACAHDDPCRDDLYGGTCLRADDDEPGYCTAPCASDAACAAAGFGTCRPGPQGGSFCQP